MTDPALDPDQKRWLEEKLRQTCELHDLGVQLMRQNLRRRNPDATAEELEDRLTAWLWERPGAEFGDVGGRIRVRQ